MRRVLTHFKEQHKNPMKPIPATYDAVTIEETYSYKHLGIVQSSTVSQPHDVDSVKQT